MSEEVAIDLPSFVFLTEKLLGKLIDLREDVLPEDLREPAAKAWGEFKRKEHALVAQARDLPSVTLDKVGLYQEQMSFKLATYNHILGCFRKTKERSWLRRLFKITDDILGSLVQVLTVAESLKVMEENLDSAMAICECEKEGGSPDDGKLPDDFDF
jgi:hypothetical protein